MTPSDPVPAHPEVELRGSLDVRPRRRLGLSSRSVERESHCRRRAVAVAGELAGVRDACVRRQARTERDHSLERCERIVVAAELDERVTDDAVRSVGAGQQQLGATPVRQRSSELVLDERERAESEHRVPVVVSEAEGPSQRHLDRGRYEGSAVSRQRS